MADQIGGAAVDSAAAPLAPQPPHRRRRVREVSSRFMSPLAQSISTPAPTSNTSNFPHIKSVHRRHPSETDENLMPGPYRGDLYRSSVGLSTAQRKQHQERVKQPLKENGEIKYYQQCEVRVSSRPDTPISIGTERIVPSRYRQLSNSVSRSNPLNSSLTGCSAVTAAARLLQETTSDVEKKLSRISTSGLDDSSSCITNSNQGISSPVCVPIPKARCATDVGSSMPNTEKWLMDRNLEDSSNGCARSLKFPSRPPHPSRKGKKASNHQEDVHSLKMLSNHYLQWRFANARAEAWIQAQKQEAEKKLCSLGGKISDLRSNVKDKRIELAVLRQMKTLITIVEAQMPYLDAWFTLEENYSNSLASATKALLSASVRLPVSGEVRVDVGQLEEALNSSFKVIECIGSRMHRFTQKAEEMDILASELAGMVGREKVLAEEYWYLLSKTDSSQVIESSLKAGLMQLKSQVASRRVKN